MTPVALVLPAGVSAGTRTSRLPVAQLEHAVTPGEVFGSDSWKVHELGLEISSFQEANEVC